MTILVLSVLMVAIMSSIEMMKRWPHRCLVAKVAPNVSSAPFQGRSISASERRARRQRPGHEESADHLVGNGRKGYDEETAAKEGRDDMERARKISKKKVEWSRLLKGDVTRSLMENWLEDQYTDKKKRENVTKSS